MRILANYGVRANGDSYTVTFETMGDVPQEKAPATVDDLFRLAKEAIQRQLGGSALPSQEPPAHPGEGVPLPAAGSGNGKKPRIKDPSLPATPKQVNLLRRLARETRTWLENPEVLTMGEASEKIDELQALRLF